MAFYLAFGIFATVALNFWASITGAVYYWGCLPLGLSITGVVYHWVDKSKSSRLLDRVSPSRRSSNPATRTQVFSLNP